MNLRNYDNVIAAQQLCVINSTCISTGEHANFADGHLTVKTKETTPKIYRIYGSSSTGAGYGMPNVFRDMKDVSGGLICGGGDTPVTYDDYNLANQFTTNDVYFISCETTDTTYDEATNTFTRTMKKIFSARKDLTIKEIGFSSYATCLPSEDSSTGSTYDCLMYRKVLDEPITVEKNSNFELTFTTVVSACANKPAEYDASVVAE